MPLACIAHGVLRRRVSSAGRARRHCRSAQAPPRPEAIAAAGKRPAADANAPAGSRRGAVPRATRGWRRPLAAPGSACSPRPQSAVTARSRAANSSLSRSRMSTARRFGSATAAGARCLSRNGKLWSGRAARVAMAASARSASSPPRSRHRPASASRGARRSYRRARSQTRMVVSSLPVSRVRPSGENANGRTPV